LTGGAASAEKRPAYVETMYAYLDFAAAPVRAMTDGRYKVIDVPQPEIYDLAKDPDETRNLAADKAIPQAEALRARLAKLPGAPVIPSQKIGEDESNALKSLGYIGAGGDYTLSRAGMDPKVFAPIYLKLNTVRAMTDAKRFGDVVPLYKELLKSFPRSTVLACELGLIEMALGKTADATAHLTLALDRNPGNTHAMLGLANLAVSRQDYRAAEGHLLDVLKLDPDDVEANFDLGALYFQNLGEKPKAVRYWQRFVELQPQDPEAPRLRALMEELKGKRAR
jgi:tetratricopeptide (TPR) repeat protein